MTLRVGCVARAAQPTQTYNTDAMITNTMTKQPVKWISWEEHRAEAMRDPVLREIHNETILASTFSIALSSYRAEHGLSQTALGRLLGMTQPQVCRMEAGDHTPDFRTMQRVCDLLGLELTITIGPRLDENRPIPKALQRGAVADSSTQAVVSVRPAKPAA